MAVAASDPRPRGGRQRDDDDEPKGPYLHHGVAEGGQRQAERPRSVRQDRQQLSGAYQEHPPSIARQPQLHEHEKRCGIDENTMYRNARPIACMTGGQRKAGRNQEHGRYRRRDDAMLAAASRESDNDGEKDERRLKVEPFHAALD